jgi:hypothetical protein
MDLLSTSSLFQQFLNQRRFLHNVTPSTIEWHETAFKALQRTHGTEPPLTRANLQSFVVDLRHRGVKPISCNTYIKALNAFCKWLHDEGHAPERLELATLRLITILGAAASHPRPGERGTPRFVAMVRSPVRRTTSRSRWS